MINIIIDDLLRLLSFQDENTRVVLAGTALLGMASGIIGSFAVLRKRALVGDAVAHASLPGVCVAYLLINERSFVWFLFGALIFGILTTTFIAFIKNYTRVKEDAAIGISIGGFFGLGIVLSRIIQNYPSGNKAGLETFIFGKAASMVRSDVYTIAAVSAVILLTIALLYKEFKLLCFDADFAKSQGWPVLRLDLTLMGLICLCTVVGLPAAGVVLMVSLLVIPAVAARFWTDRLSTLLLLAGGFGMSAGLLGTTLSAIIPAPSSGLSRGWPTGPMITLVATTFFILSMLLAPKRGLLANWLKQRRFKQELKSAQGALLP